MMKRTVLSFVLMGAAVTTAANSVRNGGLGRRGANPPYFTQETVQKLREKGWTCPDVDRWPWWWSAWGARVKVDWPREGGRAGGYGRISGAAGYVSGYYGYPITGDLVLTVWTRGSGSLRPGLMAYARNEEKGVVGTAPLYPAPVAVKSEHWVRVRFLLRKTPELHTAHVMIGCPEGTVDFDEVDLRPATPADARVVAEEERLRAAGGLIMNADVVVVDDALREHVRLYRRAAADFGKVAGRISAPLRESLRANMRTVDPYVLRENKTAVHAQHYNEMLVLTRVLTVLAGQPAPAATPVTATPAAVAIKHRPGERAARPATVTITNIRSNKVRYDENETAVTKATLVNTSAREYAGTLVVVMHLDVDGKREIARRAFSIPSGAKRTSELRYRVGPETYGRGIEVRFVEHGGTVVDSWQEYYAVAAEWFRVQQHTHNAQMKSYTVDPWVTYFNQSHNFAGEPTDWGVQVDMVEDLEKYISSQPLYRLNMPARRARYAHLRRLGIMGTFYQTFACSGQMGYEVIRQHPEFALYDPNGQPAVDPIYGGYPNPMELASPMETGPKRAAMNVKPHLERKLNSWYHNAVNYARTDVVRYMAERIQEYAEFLGCGGVYVDGNVGVLAGLAYDGRPNTSGKYGDYVRLNARNHNLFSEILKTGNPNFGTWFNWAKGSAEHWTAAGQTFYYGSGVGTDRKDDAVRAATGWQNVMFLDETRSQFRPGDRDENYPDRHLTHLCDNRDYLVQGYGANVIIGYIGNYHGISTDAPGPDRWGWATHNYFGAQLIATQHHFVSWFVPSWRPTIQFMTRYSRLIWAPDIKAVSEPEQLVQVESQEALWWKRLVYRRNTNAGHDLIVHLVRVPPYEKWDLTWLDEPKPLDAVRIAVDAGQDRLLSAHSMRPYYFDEPQQPVQRPVAARTIGGRVEIAAPEFRYHIMVVFRFEAEGVDE